ncbi:unnamed protein product [Albugo candida]|uniref:Uncharacterized protein n=1 Tax=Albugo candida TaxID=65357 RepID=A0A024GIY9_9STRA|nr:unnamed protein product [Albugo candida]|eukprot:CCI46309.1 unnamed protein product [Albugo candida]
MEEKSTQNFDEIADEMNNELVKTTLTSIPIETGTRFAPLHSFHTAGINAMCAYRFPYTLRLHTTRHRNSHEISLQWIQRLRRQDPRQSRRIHAHQQYLHYQEGSWML